MKLDLVEHRDGTLIVRLLGELDRMSGPLFQRMMESAAGPGRRRVVVNLKGIDCLDSYNIATLVALRGLLDARGISPVFVSDVDTLRHLLQLAGLGDRLTLAASEEEALKPAAGG